MRYKYFLLILSLFISLLASAQNVGVGTTTPAAQLSVGPTSQFRVNSTGNIIRINDLPYSFPSTQGTNQYLKNDGAGNLSWAPVTRPVVRVFSAVPNQFFSAWLIDNTTDYVSGNNANPTITLQRGLTYQFTINAPGHPFTITNTPGMGTFSTGLSANGIAIGTITFTVPMDAPATLYYYCSVHAAMNGVININ